MCGDEKHKDKIFFCKTFRGLTVPQKKAALEKLGACRKCLGCHDEDRYCRDAYLCRNRDCKRGSSADHHYFLCPRGEFQRGEERIGKKQTKKSKIEQADRGAGEFIV